MNNWLEKTNCPKCDVEPDFLHESGCDFERCSCCGNQYTCDGEMPLFWAGYYPGTLEAVEQNLFVRVNRNSEGPPWLPGKMDKDHPDAFPDINSVYGLGTWNKEKQKFVFNDK